MTTAVLASTEVISIPLAKIRVAGNVRDLDHDHVTGLASSIQVLGLITAVTVAPIPAAEQVYGYEYDLVAGFHRYAAVSKLGHDTIQAGVRFNGSTVGDADSAAAAAAENIARKQLNPYEEALAVQAMLANNLTEHGAAQALGWSQARVTARVKLLQLPEKAQKLAGAGVLPLSYVELLRAVGDVNGDLLELLADFIDERPDMIYMIERDLGRLIQAAVTESDSKVFVASLTQATSRQIADLKLPKGTLKLYAELDALTTKINAYSYGQPAVRFADVEVDQARAAQVIVEGGHAPLIVDKPLYRELVKQAIARSVTEAQATLGDRAERRKLEQTEAKAQRAADPETDIRRDHGQTMRALAAQAHGANTDLGWALRNNLAAVDPASMDVARFFVYALLESGTSWIPGSDSDRVSRIATAGVRLVVDEFRTDVTKTKKDGSRGALRIDYGKPGEDKDIRTWMWKFIDAAKTAGDLYGRALVVIAAEHYASRLVVPSSQQHPPLAWGSHQDKAIKALEKLAGPHVPATLKNLEKAVKKAKTEYDRQLTAARKAKVPAGEYAGDDEDLDGIDDEDLDGDPDEFED